MSDRTTYVITIENVTSDQEMPVSDIIAGIFGDLGEVSRTDAGALRFEITDVDYNSAAAYASQLRSELVAIKVTSAFTVYVSGVLSYNARLVMVDTDGETTVSQADERGNALIAVADVAEALGRGEGALRKLLSTVGVAA